MLALILVSRFEKVVMLTTSYSAYNQDTKIIKMTIYVSIIL